MLVTVASSMLDVISVNFVGWLSALAVATTVCLFLTGFEICWRIRVHRETLRHALELLNDSIVLMHIRYEAQKTTDGISSAPFHMGFLSGQLWLQYGLLRHDKAVICVNSIASLLNSYYLSYYFMMAPYTTKKRCIRFVFVEVIFLMGMHYYIHYHGSPVEVVRSNLGSFCVIFNVITVAAPLEALREVLRTRCTHTMPLPLCFFTLLVTTEWLLYGILIDDVYIKVPNAIAIVIAIAQLLPFLYFPRSRQMAAVVNPNTLI